MPQGDRAQGERLRSAPRHGLGPAEEVETAIPLRDNQRAQARAFVKRLDDATRIFAEQAYAEQLIRDVSEHRATTVAELLAFMRQYRLLFSDPGNSPEVASLYEGLYGLLRQQIKTIGIDLAPVAHDALRAGSVWEGRLTFKNQNMQKVAAKKAVGKKAASKKSMTKKAMAKRGDGNGYKLTVQTRNGDQFSGESNFRENAARKVTGTVRGGRINYQETDAGGSVIEFDGTINGSEIVFTFTGKGQQGRQISGDGRITRQ